MTLSAFDTQGQQIDFETYYSVGGGFVATAEQLQNGTATADVTVTYPLPVPMKCCTKLKTWFEFRRNDSA